jgi:P27 family predicted phage terminase small subunit
MIEIPRPPKRLRDKALKEWRRITVELSKYGLIAEMDRQALVIYCDAVQDYEEAREAMAEEDGRGLQTTPTGYEALSGNAVKARQAAATIEKFGALFGMTPAARSRVTASPQMSLFDDARDPTARYFG